MLGSATEELAQLTDPRQTQWDAKEPVKDAEDAALLRLGGNVSIACQQTKGVGMQVRIQWSLSL